MEPSNPLHCRVKNEQKESSDDEEIDICSNECEDHSRMSQETMASACSSSQCIFTEEESSSNSVMDLSISQASCSSFTRSSLSAGPSKLGKKRIRVTSTSNDNESEDGEGISRKEKSLGLLCKKFLLVMGEEARSGKDVHLESVAKKMMVEKRRIYDIVNVMEALEAMSKTNKSYYRWRGLGELPQLMASLQKQAKEENLLSRIQRVEQAMCSFTELSSSSKKCSGDIVGTLVVSKTHTNDSGYFSGSQEESPLEERCEHLQVSEATCGIRQQSVRDRNSKNSLAQLCRRFLMVLLCNPKDTRRVSLDVASTVLIKDPENEGFEPPSRSRCRRLYDIANVLVAMGIIKKVHYLFGTKKIPLFVYSGPEPYENDPICESKENSVNKNKSPKKYPLLPVIEENGEVPSKRANVFENKQRFGNATQNSLRPVKQRSDLEILAVASEQRRKEYEASEKFVLTSSCDNDENVENAKCFRVNGCRSVPVIRTVSGAVILKPEAKKLVKNSILNSPNNVTNENQAIEQGVMKSGTGSYQIFDPKQPHAFRKINQAHVSQSMNSVHSMRLYFGMNSDQSHFGPTVMPTVIPPLTSTYSVNAILGDSFTVPANYRMTPPCQIFRPKVSHAAQIKPRTVLGDISQTHRNNK